MPSLLTRKKFDFVSHALPADTFGVVNFKGFEGFSTCYQFEITLVATDPEIDLRHVLQNPAVFTILREEGNIPFHGILSQFEQLHAFNEYVFYRTVLVPRFRWLSLTHHNQIFLDKTVPQILEEVLKDGGLTGHDFELRLQSSYTLWEFVCQYGESHLNFVSRWMEREGMYYFFEQTAAGEKLIITDTGMAHTDMPEGKNMYYSPPSGLDEPFREEVIHAFICKQKLLPGRLHVQDYNYRTPSLDLSAESPVSPQGRGEFHLYGEHFRDLQEGGSLAGIRAQELLSQEKRFHGESTIPFLRPGYLFDLERHYRGSFNQQYLTIELEHAGSQAAWLVSGVQGNLSETEKRPYYRNSFVSIPADVQYRHPKTSPKPRFYGSINARIDAEGSGEYAELDEWGRYKVRLPFDLSGREGGKASHWLRMAQPYAGENQGMHFPLHKRTEVLLTFIEGDPDRPIIAAAVPNPESPSPVNHMNQSKSFIKTGRGPQSDSGQSDIFSFLTDNFIELEDKKNNERIIIHTPGDLWLETNAGFGDYHSDGAADISNRPSGRPDKIQTMLDYFGDAYNPGGYKPRGVGGTHFRVSNFDTFNTQEGNIYDFGGYWNYNLGNSYAENFMAQAGVTLNDGGHPNDRTAKGGPEPGSISCEKIGPLDNNTWIEKTIGGAAYEYTKDKKSLAVEVGTREESHSYKKNTYEYKYGGRSEEYKYAGDILTYESWSESGESEEKKYCRDTGSLLEHSTNRQANNTYFSSTFTDQNKVSSDIHLAKKASSEINISAVSSSAINVSSVASAEINVGAKASAGINIAAVASAEINLAVKTSLGINIGLSADFNFKLAGSFTFTAALAADISVTFAPSGTIDIKNMEVNADFFGFKYTNKPPTALETAILTLGNETMHLKGKVTDLENTTVKLDTVYTLHLMS